MFQGDAGSQKRADVVNPFAVLVDSVGGVGTALDLERGFHVNRSVVRCDAGRLTEVTVTTYTHRLHRSLLVLEIAAPDLAHGAECTVRLTNCSVGGNADFTATSGPNGSQTLTVTTMEKPPTWSADQTPPHTAVGYAAETVPPTLTLTGPTASVFVASYHTSLERGLEGSGRAAGAAAGDLAVWATDPAKAMLMPSHTAAQVELWAGGIEIAGNSTIAGTVNSSLYYILSAARADWPYGLSPGGLTRQDYEVRNTPPACYPILPTVLPPQASKQPACWTLLPPSGLFACCRVFCSLSLTVPLQ